MTDGSRLILPAELGNFLDLETLDLSGAYLGMPVPSELSTYLYLALPVLQSTHTYLD